MRNKILYILLILPFFGLCQEQSYLGGNIKGYVNGDFETNGNASIADSSYFIADSTWDDLRAPATTIRQGATTKPDFNTDSLTLDFPQNDEDEVAYINLQMPHEYLTGSDVSPHLHVLQNEAGVPSFIMEYRIITNGGATTTFITDTSLTSYLLPYTSGSIMNILEFPMIDMSSVTGVSAVLQIKLYRETGDGISGDIQVVEFDIHYRSDSGGSDSEYSKSWD